jgi:hypothetical protein
VTTREEAEKLLSSVPDDHLVEIDGNGMIYPVGKAPAAKEGKPVIGISDQKGEYLGGRLWISR